MTQKINKAQVMEVMLSKEGVNFRNSEGWNTLAEHVDVHNQFLDKKLGWNVSWDDALFSWYENIYTPLKREISSRGFKRAFSGMTSGELYLAVSDHWFYLKEKDEDVNAEIAAGNFAYVNRRKTVDLLKNFFKPTGDGNDTKTAGKKAA
jgi:hypothetical protein